MKLTLNGGCVECDEAYSGAEWQRFYQLILADEVAHVQQLKHDGTTTVYKTTIADNACVVKRYNTKNAWHFIRRGFRQSRADICYQLAGLYAQADIATPAPIAKIQAYIGPFKLRSWYVCEYIEGELLTDWVRRNFAEHLQSDQAEKPLVKIPDELVAAVSNLFARLEVANLSHGDMKATNLIWHKGFLQVIDLDSARQHPSQKTHQRAIQKDRHRFIHNWQDYPTVASVFQSAIKLKI